MVDYIYTGIELTQGQSWDVTAEIRFEHIKFINERQAYVALYIGSKSYKWRLTQHTWYEYGGWRIWAGVNPSGARVNNIYLIPPTGFKATTPIAVEYMDVKLAPDFDIASKQLYGISVLFYIDGDTGSTGKIKITWGKYGSETFDVADYALQIGQNEIGNSLPPGTHNICVVAV